MKNSNVIAINMYEGYELYLRDGSKGEDLWEKIMEAGRQFGLKPGHTELSIKLILKIINNILIA